MFDSLEQKIILRDNKLTLAIKIDINHGAFVKGPLKKVLWKRLNTETSQRGNASKTAFEGFRFILGNPSKLKKGQVFPNIFELFPNIYS